MPPFFLGTLTRGLDRKDVESTNPIYYQRSEKIRISCDFRGDLDIEGVQEALIVIQLGRQENVFKMEKRHKGGVESL